MTVLRHWENAKVVLGNCCPKQLTLVMYETVGFVKTVPYFYK